MKVQGKLGGLSDRRSLGQFGAVWGKVWGGVWVEFLGRVWVEFREHPAMKMCN